LWRYASQGRVAPAVLRSGALHVPPLLSFTVGDFDQDGADDLLNYQSHWEPTEKRVVIDKPFAATQWRSPALVSSRYEMR